MWDLSSLAKKAKEAVATIENEINDSVGYVDEGGVSSLFKTETSPAAEESNEADYFEVEEEVVSFTAADGESSEKNNENAILDESVTKDGDSSSGWDQCEDAEPKANSVTTLSEAVSKIDALEKEIKELKDELLAARDEVKSFRVSNLELEQQVRDLTEENMSLKMNMATKED